MEKNKTIIIALILIICALICSQLSSIFANTNYVTSEDLTYKELNDGTTLISGFEIGTKVSDVLNGCFLSEYDIKIFDNNNNDITSETDKIIGTGYQIRLYTVTTEENNVASDNNITDNNVNVATNITISSKSTLIKTYTVVIYGDTNNDGSVNAVDALIVVKNKLGAVLFKDSAVEEAGRVNENTRKSEETPSAVDALSIVKYKLNPEEYPINQQMNTATDDNKENTETPVALHGKLNVSETNITDKNGNNFQLRGVSTHGIKWFPQYVNQDAFEFMRDEWGINVVRLAMYSNPNDGYSRDNWNTVKNGVDYATNAGLYVIIDWHILNDNNPNTYKSEAIEFFKEMATTYKDNVNVLYEICNEPNGDVTWERDIKPYAEEVIAEIRAIDNDAIIICGTPTYSQDVDVVSQSPITDYDNIVYALHFYAATHKEDLRAKLTTAINNGLPVFVSEFGICDASGNGAIDVEEANTWMILLNKNNISWICWNLSNKDEASALLSSTTDKVTDWTEEELSQEGKWLVGTLKSPRIYYKFENTSENCNITINIKDGNGIKDVSCTLDINGKESTYLYSTNNATVRKNTKGDIIEIEYKILITKNDYDSLNKITTLINEKSGNVVTFEKIFNK